MGDRPGLTHHVICIRLHLASMSSYRIVPAMHVLRQNNRYPKLPKPVTLQRRFAVEESLKGWKKRPENGQQIWCTSFVNNALDKGGGPGHLACPYALESPNPPRNQEDRAVFTGHCREQCVATSGCAGPKRKDHWKPWATPASALKEALERAEVDEIL